MTLTAGTRLGPYEILEPLGAGSMGVVHGGRDTRLGRDLAIKVLPAEMSADPDRLRRLEKEARAASALNHPNIVTIYEIDEIDSVRFIAMERVEGKTLRAILDSGSLSIKSLLDVATQVAAGLAKAHEAGIVHRDLKPENIMVTHDGLVKILDFGLAKLTEGAPGRERMSDLPTEGGTSPGVVVGTVSYMSPEQASGRLVDVRSDQFSFGSILYEMATGTRAFHEATAVDTLSGILHDEPEPVAVLNPAVPAPLRWTIERCHSKDPRDRYDSTSDLARELSSLRLHLSEVRSSSSNAAATPSLRPRRWRLQFAVAAIAVLGVAAGLGLARWVNGPELPRFLRLTFRHGMTGGAHFAPGGQAIIYSASVEGRPFRVFTMILGTTDSHDLGIDGRVVDVSPTGDLLVLVSQDPFGGATGSLWLASVSGAAPRALAEGVRVAAFSPDGSQIALIRPLNAPGLRSRLEFPMGKVLYESKNELFGRPAVSSDGGRVTVAERTGTVTNILSIDGAGRRSTIVSLPRTPDVYTFAGLGGRNWIMRGDERSGAEVLELTASGRLRSRLRVPLYLTLDDVALDGRWLVSSFWSRREMLVLDEGAAVPRPISWLGASIVADLSADGRTVLFTEQTSENESTVYIRRIDGSPPVRLGAGEALSLSPDGRWALAVRNPGADELALYPTGPGETRTIAAPGVKLVGGRFFPESDRLLVYGSDEGGTRSYILPIGGGVPHPVALEAAWLPLGRGEGPVVAPDGRTVVFETRDGWRRVASDGGEADPVSVRGLGNGERVIRFRDDGKAVFTKREEEDAIVIEAVELETGRRSLVRRLALGEGAFASARLHPVCITPDGRTVVYSVLSATSDIYLVEGLK